MRWICMYRSESLPDTPPRTPRRGFRPHLSLEWRQTTPVASTCHGVIADHAELTGARRGPASIAGAGPRRVRRPVWSVGPDEPVQQRVRVGVHPLVDDGDEGDPEDGVGEAGEAAPSARVSHRVLVGVVPSVGDVQRLDGTDAAVVGDLVEGPWFAGAGSSDLVDGAELEGLEVGCSGQAGYRPAPLGVGEVHCAAHDRHRLPGPAAGQAVQHDVGGFQPALYAPEADAG